MFSSVSLLFFAVVLAFDITVRQSRRQNEETVLVFGATVI